MGSICLLDRTKWPERRYLSFDLEEILNRKEDSTLRATAALLHRESICPEEGFALLDTLDDNSHRHAFSVSEKLKDAVGITTRTKIVKSAMTIRAERPKRYSRNSGIV
jgi:hypothetical protein